MRLLGGASEAALSVLTRAMFGRSLVAGCLGSPRFLRSAAGTHYHTQHPLELTNFLNGYDALGNTDDRERWREAWAAWEEPSALPQSLQLRMAVDGNSCNGV